MRITKSNKRNRQDWDAADHDRAGHPQTLPPLVQARSSIQDSIYNLEVASAKLLDRPAARNGVLAALRALNAALEVI